VRRMCGALPLRPAGALLRTSLKGYIP